MTRIAPSRNPFTPDASLDRDVAALIGLGLPDAEGFRADGQPLREWLVCAACGTRGVTLHHLVPNWICRARRVREVLEPLCPECHAAAERLNWRAVELALRREDLPALAVARNAALAPAVAAWEAWTRWERRRRNLARAKRERTPEGEEAGRQAAAARRALARHRDRLRSALRGLAADICHRRIAFADMAAAWKGRGTGAVDVRRFVR